MTQAVSIQSCLQNGNIMGALKHAEMWVIQERENAEAWFWRGTVQAAGQLEEEAIKSWQQSLTLLPTHRGASHNLTLALMKAGRIEEARDHLLATEKHLPNDGQVKAWLGHVWSALSKTEKALHAYEKAISLAGRDAQLLKLAALCARDLGNAQKAHSLLSQALELAPNDPNLRFEQGCINLSLGNYKAGFLGYEFRWARDTMQLPNLPMPLWQGEDLTGKTILIHDEQGIGDTFMFVRFLKNLTEKGAKVFLWTRPYLRRVLSSIEANITIVTEADHQADYHCPLMSLPYRLGLIDETDFSANNQYLFTEENLREYWQEKLAIAGGKKKVGLIWQGDPNSQAEKGRSQSFAAYLPHLKPDHHYFILQCMHGRDELNDISLPDNVTDLGEILDQGPDAFHDTAAVMSLLDLVITTDTGPAHLAGALGLKTHLILQTAPEWRWGNQGTTSPWYPSFTLLRDNIAAAFD